MKSILQITTLIVLVSAPLGCTPHSDDGHKKDNHKNIHIEDKHTENNEEHENHSDEDRDRNSEMTIRQSESHVHGDAVLAIALDGSTLIIELETPLYNLVGFEHEPNTDAEHALLAKTNALLNKPEALFSLSSEANCKPGRSSHELDHHDDHARENNSDHNSEQADHQDIVLEYTYTCSNPDKLSFVKTNLFDLFPNLTDLDAIYVGPNTQKQATLKPGNTQLDMKR